MKYIAIAILLLIGWQIYSLGYKSGLRASADYSAAIREKALTAESETIKRLEAMLALFPTKEQCVPVMLGSQVDEYTFCEELLASQRSQEAEALDAMTNEREQEWGR